MTNEQWMWLAYLMLGVPVMLRVVRWLKPDGLCWIDLACVLALSAYWPVPLIAWGVQKLGWRSALTKPRFFKKETTE